MAGKWVVNCLSAVVSALLLSGGVLLAHDAGHVFSALRLTDRKTVPVPHLLREAQGARLVFIGEDHTNEENHKAQLAIISELHGAGAPIAIGLEMFTADAQGKLDSWVAGQLPVEDFIRIYRRQWSLPWRLYRDIFLYAREHRIPLIGLNVPRAVTRKVAQHGFSSLTPEERKKLPSGITCTVDPAYRAMIRQAYAHHARTDKFFEHFCEAQMLWNKAMGWHLRQFLGRNPGMTVVVLAGVGHLMKGGIPLEVFRDSSYRYLVLLPELPELNRTNLTEQDADYLLLFNEAGSE